MPVAFACQQTMLRSSDLIWGLSLSPLLSFLSQFLGLGFPRSLLGCPHLGIHAVALTQRLGRNGHFGGEIGMFSMTGGLCEV
mmetsp:Transcript_19081/g.72136  ORF Transcript_19081/g.72136 Transcript_19081/m.72136 type:complete len:82 (+) Transcript_19081:2116-2361(+)